MVEACLEVERFAVVNLYGVAENLAGDTCSDCSGERVG